MLKKKIIITGLLAFFAFLTAHSQTLLKGFRTVGSSATLGNALLFAADDGVHGTELWKTDGTATGTTLVKDIRPGINPSFIDKMFVYNNKAYFQADDGINGIELWQSDGTAAGTVLLKNINTQAGDNSASFPSNFTVFNGALYFTAETDGNFSTLWKTDGTAAGTVPVTDADNRSISQLTVVGNTLYFTKSGTSLWKSDGTNAGTQQIQVDDYYTVEMLANVNNNELVFITSYTYTHDNIRLYKIDPANNTPVMLHSYDAVTYGSNDIGNITPVGSNILFSIHTVDANDNGVDALWNSDGTPAGTSMITSWAWQSHIGNSYAAYFKAFNNKLYFAGTTDHTLWASDGTLAGTKKLTSVIVEGYMVQSGSSLYFNGNGNLYGFDGTTATRQSQSPANPAPLTSVNNKLYFTAPNGYFENQLWDNAPAPQIQVNAQYGAWANSTTQTFTARADSIQTSPITIVNLGNQPLTISDISVAGDAFYVNGHPSRTIAPNGQTSFNLIYYPLKQGKDNAVLLIKSTDNNGQQNFNGILNGTATGEAVKLTVQVDSLAKKIVFRDSIPAFTLSTSTIAENADPGTTIGSFKVNDTTAGYQFQLVAGAGDYNNSSFQIVNGQLQSAATFNFSAKDTYVIRVKAASNTASYQKSFPIQVSNVQATLPAQNCAPVFQGLMFSLYDAVYVGGRIVAVGTAGTILISDDDGVTWKSIKSGISSDLSTVRFTDNQTGYILGTTAMLKTEDGGNTWFPLALPVNNNYTVMSFPSSTTGYVIGGGTTYNYFYKTTDGGRTWKTINPVTTNGMNSIWFKDEKNGFIGGGLITLLHTTDGGATWQPVSLNLSDTFSVINGISFFNASIGFLTTNSGDILKTTDGGVTWTKISALNTDGFLSRVYMLDQNTGYIMCGYNQATLYKTTDGGVTWQNDNTGVITVFRAMAINSSGTKLCVVGLGTDLASPSYGSSISLKSGSGSWVPRSFITPDSYGGGTFVGGNLFANGDGFVFGPTSNFRTTDAGLTWSSMNIVPDWYNTITNGTFVNTTTGFYTDYYHMYRSTDGGNSWTKVLTDSLSLIHKIYFFDAQHGFYINDAYAGMTTDGGNTWSKSLVTGQGIPISDIRFLDAQHGYAVFLGFFYKTTDGGQTWSSTDLGSDKYLMSVYFTGVNNGLIGGSNGLLLHTADGGTTWTTVVTPFQFDVSKLVFYDAQHGCAIDNNPGGVNLLYETFDGGLTWNPAGANWSTISGFNINDGQLFTTGSTISKLSSDGLGPVNAGYIAGSTQVATGNKVLYSVPAEQGITYQWAVTGADEVEFHNDTIYVVWKQGGQYNLQVTPYNSCGAGLSRSMDVNVLDMPDPVITGPDSVASHAANVVYTAPAETGRSYSWTAQGSSISSTDNQAKVSWGAPGDGLVAVIKTDTVLNLRKSGSLQVKINKTALPSTNFKVSVTSATCKGTDDGYISVVAQASYDYTAVVTGPNSFSKTYAFTDSMKVSSLAAGSYNVCIGLKDDASFHQCYGLNLTEPKDLSVYSTVNPANGTVTLDLSGANVYNITLNGMTYQTKAGQITMSLNKGANKLELSSDKECQGIIVRYINLNKITLYPDPFADHISIDLGGSTATQTKVEIRDINGRVLYSKKQLNTSGALNVDVPGLQSGSYLLQLTLDDQSTVFKIVRK